MPKGKIIYELRSEKLRSIRRHDLYITIFSMPLLMCVIFLFTLSNVRQGFTLSNILSQMVLIILMILLVYFGSVSHLMKNKEMIIDSNGLVPLTNPFWKLTTKGIFIPYNDIKSVSTSQYHSARDIYKVEIINNTNEKYHVDSRYLFHYKLSKKEILRIRRLFEIIQTEIENHNNQDNTKDEEITIDFPSS